MGKLTLVYRLFFVCVIVLLVTQPAVVAGGKDDDDEDDDPKVVGSGEGFNRMDFKELAGAFNGTTITPQTLIDWAWNRNVTTDITTKHGIRLNSSSTFQRDPFVFTIGFQSRPWTGFYVRLYTKRGRYVMGYTYTLDRIIAHVNSTATSIELANSIPFSSCVFGSNATTSTQVDNARVFEWNSTCRTSSNSTVVELNGMLSTQSVNFNGVELNPFEHSVKVTVRNLPTSVTSRAPKFYTVLGNVLEDGIDAKDNTNETFGFVHLNKYASIIYRKEVNGSAVALSNSSRSQQLGFQVNVTGVSAPPLSVQLVFRTNAFQALADAYKLWLALPNATRTVASKTEEQYKSNRTVNMTDSSDDKVTVRTQGKEENKTRSFAPQFTLKFKPFPHVRATFVKQNGTEVEMFSYRIGILRLVEVNAQNTVTNSTNSFSFSRDLPWIRLSTTQVNVTSASGANVTLLQLSSSFTIASGAFKGLKFVFTGFIGSSMFQKSDAEMISPESLKYTLTIENFPYNFTDSNLAIVKAIWSRAKRLRGNSTSQVSVGGYGSFTWIQQAVADSMFTAVKVEMLGNSSVRVADTDNDRKDETVEFVAFKFNAITPKVVSWDPEVGVSSADIVNADSAGADTAAGDPAISPDSTSCKL
jgi:hypothetical protein